MLWWGDKVMEPGHGPERPDGGLCCWGDHSRGGLTGVLSLLQAALEGPHWL